MRAVERGERQAPRRVGAGGIALRLRAQRRDLGVEFDARAEHEHVALEVREAERRAQRFERGRNGQRARRLAQRERDRRVAAARLVVRVALSPTRDVTLQRPAHRGERGGEVGLVGRVPVCRRGAHVIVTVGAMNWLKVVWVGSVSTESSDSALSTRRRTR